MVTSQNQQSNVCLNNVQIRIRQNLCIENIH